MTPAARLPGAPRIALVSPCGWGNLGDAAIVQGVIQAVRNRWPHADLVALTLNPSDTEARHGIPAMRLSSFSRPSYSVAGMEGVGGVRSAWRAITRELGARTAESGVLEGCDLVLVAGGGQLDDYWGGAWGHPYALWKWARMARRRGIPVAIVGTGFGTARSALSRGFLRGTLRMAARCTVRDEGSLQLARALGAHVPLQVCPDLAFGVSAAATRRDEAGAFRVGISPMAFADPRVWPEKDPAAYRSYVARLSETVLACMRAGHEVHLFSTDGPDRTTVIEVAGTCSDAVRAGSVVTHDTTTVDAVFALLSRLDAVVASRLHGVILAMVALRPVVAICYERKVDRVMRDFGLERFALQIDTFAPAAVLASLEQLRRERSAIGQGLEAQVASYRARLGDEYTRVFGLVRGAA